LQKPVSAFFRISGDKTYNKGGNIKIMLQEPKISKSEPIPVEKNNNVVRYTKSKSLGNKTLEKIRQRTKAQANRKV